MKRTTLLIAALLSINLAFAADAPVPDNGQPLTGEVLEVLQTPSYTYLRLRTADGEIWAAVAKVPAKEGDKVTIQDPAVMEDFQSAILGRTFPTIVFGTVGTAAATSPVQPTPPAQASASAPPTAQPSPHATGSHPPVHGNTARAAEVDVAKVEKAQGTNGRTVAEINAGREDLKDQTVVIRATVVKVSANVMGKNWVHLRDGSGSAADGSNDVLATSSDEPKVGDVVLAMGVVRTDVNLGSGYVYKVILEDVSFRQ